MKGQHKLNKRQAKWMKVLEQFLMWKYKKGKSNVVVDALSIRHNLFSKLGIAILEFNHISELMNKTLISLPFLLAVKRKHMEFYMFPKAIYLMKENFVCPNRKLLVKETYEGGLMGHFWVDKTLSILEEKYYWPHMRKQV